MKYKQVSYKFAWQCVRRFECGVKFYAKGRDEKYYKLKNLRSLVKAIQSGNLYTLDNRDQPHNTNHR